MLCKREGRKRFSYSNAVSLLPDKRSGAGALHLGGTNFEHERGYMIRASCCTGWWRLSETNLVDSDQECICAFWPSNCRYIKIRKWNGQHCGIHKIKVNNIMYSLITIPPNCQNWIESVPLVTLAIWQILQRALNHHFKSLGNSRLKRSLVNIKLLRIRLESHQITYMIAEIYVIASERYQNKIKLGRIKVGSWNFFDLLSIKYTFKIM